MRKILIPFLLLFTAKVFAQPNCEAYKFYGDSLKYKACITAEKRAGHYQFSRAYQEALDEALAIDSTFAYAYKAKSTAYLKSGDFITWKALMDKAVQYEPQNHLDYRGWCRYQFFRDYKGAIQDIELLDSLVDYDIGYSVNGFYHLHLARALCYKALGETDKAIQIIEQHLQEDEYQEGLYDYIHLGVLYMEKGKYQQAIAVLTKQEAINDLAENRFHIALAYKAINNRNAYLSNIQTALQLYQNRQRMLDPYVEQMDKIYLEDIEKELQKAKSMLSSSSKN